jgi:hypothetical protein
MILTARSPSSLLIASSRSLVGLPTPNDGWRATVGLARLFCCFSATAQEKKTTYPRTGVARHNQALAPSYPDTSAEYLIALITVFFGMAIVLGEESRAFVIDDAWPGPHPVLTGQAA